MHYVSQITTYFMSPKIRCVLNIFWINHIMQIIYLPKRNSNVIIYVLLKQLTQIYKIKQKKVIFKE